MTQRWAPQTCYTLRRNTAIIMKGLVVSKSVKMVTYDRIRTRGLETVIFFISFASIAAP